MANKPTRSPCFTNARRPPVKLLLVVMLNSAANHMPTDKLCLAKLNEYLRYLMRRLSAFILLIPFAILLFGAVNLSSICPQTSTSASDQLTSQSCTQSSDACCNRCADRPSDPPSGQPACCFNCPLCALITVPAIFQFEPASTEKATEFAVRPDNRLTDYPHSHWKPPNHSRLS